MFVERLAEQELREALKMQAAVGMIGPRQVGKTTLAHKLAEENNGLYLDLENLTDRRQLAEPIRFFELNADRLIVLDEIHHMPELFSTLRGVIDKDKRANKGKGRFLILGSASVDLLRQSGESLAGRIAYLDLAPLTLLEVDDSLEAEERLWVRGGFPEVYLAPDDKTSFNLRLHLKRTYLQRDIPMFAPRLPAQTLERLWMMLAHLQGTTVNNAELGRSLGVGSKSVGHYIDLLCDLLLVRRLMPYYGNVKKRLVKSPRLYIRDSGLLHMLLNIKDRNRLGTDPIFGKSWEGFAIENMMAHLPAQSQPFFYRTSNGAEIDFLIEHPDRSFWAVEIKYSIRAKVERGFYSACDDLKPARKFIVHAGQERFPLPGGIEALGLRDILKELRAYSE